VPKLVPKKSDGAQEIHGAQEIRFFGKIGFLKQCAQTGAQESKTVCPNRCPRNPMVPKKSDFLEKSDFSNSVPKPVPKKSDGAQEILGFLPKHSRTPVKVSLQKPT
jgi:hypothetical protein